MTKPSQPPALTQQERRAKRQARREKQRLGNVGRAAKMHRERVTSEGLPRHAGAPSKSAALRGINVGCSGWFYWHWKNVFYPADLPMNRWFDHYARSFKTVELNAPFYSWPTIANVRKWLQQAGRRKFIYTVKVCELITHVKRFKGTKTLVRDFGFIADILGDRMGCFLFQLPPSFHYTQARLEAILGQLDPARRNVVEFRHRSWWRQNVYDRFQETGTIFCSCSGPRLPSDLVKTAKDVYLRFHGATQWYRHDYSRAELAEWAAKIRASGTERVWAYFNNDRDGHAIKNARSLARMLRGKTTGKGCFREAAAYDR